MMKTKKNQCGQEAIMKMERHVDLFYAAHLVCGITHFLASSSSNGKIIGLIAYPRKNHTPQHMQASSHPQEGTRKLGMHYQSAATDASDIIIIIIIIFYLHRHQNHKIYPGKFFSITLSSSLVIITLFCSLRKWNLKNLQAAKRGLDWHWPARELNHPWLEN